MKTNWYVNSNLISFNFYGSKKELEQEMASLADDIDGSNRRSVTFDVSTNSIRQRWTVSKTGRVTN